jgi:hypothetical protein
VLPPVVSFARNFEDVSSIAFLRRASETGRGFVNPSLHWNSRFQSRRTLTRCWLLFVAGRYEQRGTQDGTLDNYYVPIRTLLEHLGDVPERLNAQRLRQCFLKYTDDKNHTSIQHAATALRMFVRFLITEAGRSIGPAGRLSMMQLLRRCFINSEAPASCFRG